MIGRIKASIANVKVTSAIVCLVVVAIILSISAVTLAVYSSLGTSLRVQATMQQQANLKAAATILSGNLPGSEAKWADDGELSGLVAWAMPRQFLNHDIVDSIVRITGESATIFSWDEAQQDFVRMTTTIVNEKGERILGTTLGKTSPAYQPVMDGKTYFGEATIVGRPYYTAYQPIVDQGGKAVGVLYVGVDRARVDATIGQLLQLLLIVGGGVLVVLGTAGFFIARMLLAPVPRLAKVMEAIASGDYEAEVPYVDRRNEAGAMAKAVEVFRVNGLKMTEMTEEERVASQRRGIERTDMMVALQAAFGEVVDAAIAGDFSKRVHAKFPDSELNSLARSVNALVETVDSGVSETAVVLGALARTDLTVRMQGNFTGAFAKLKDDANAVAETLSEVVGKLKQTSRSIKTATGEILSGANDLSERTTKQAATIEQTSAAMEQLAHTVLQNADRARDANADAQLVSRTAEEGGEVMSRATLAMAQISASSGKISNIIGLIDDIAFQTNLLALNASVEAARAGDAGKGFAVVAVEVRRLAQSAAQASSDVKALIDMSSGEVGAGTKLVEEAATKLASMLDAARSNSALMDGIARDSREQAGAIEEVTVAVRLMDEMTQHNAALVEQTNAAIEQTEGQANELDRIVAVFHTDDRSAGSMPAASRPAAPKATRAAPQKAAGAYLSGNAALSADWDEF